LAPRALTDFVLRFHSLLGDTIEKIAWQKAGIMKKGRPTFVDPNQSQVKACLHEQ
jgi:folylpolyglutamate synthase/dihydropteroate synthase